jgi:hypothetical protein
MGRTEAHAPSAQKNSTRKLQEERLERVTHSEESSAARLPDAYAL